MKLKNIKYFIGYVPGVPGTTTLQSNSDNNLHKIDSSISGAIKHKLNEDSQELYTLRDTAAAYDYNKPFYYKFAKNHKKKR